MSINQWSSNHCEQQQTQQHVICGPSVDNYINDTSLLMTGGNRFTGSKWLRGMALSSVCLWAGRPCCENRLLFIRLFSINRRGANACLHALSSFKPPTQTIRPTQDHSSSCSSPSVSSFALVFLFCYFFTSISVGLYFHLCMLFSPSSGVEGGIFIVKSCHWLYNEILIQQSVCRIRALY